MDSVTESKIAQKGPGFPISDIYKIMPDRLQFTIMSCFFFVFLNDVSRFYVLLTTRSGFQKDGMEVRAKVECGEMDEETCGLFCNEIKYEFKKCMKFEASPTDEIICYCEMTGSK